MNVYEEYAPTFADRACWTVPWVLRERARTHGDSIYLDAPGAGERHSYAEVLARAERIASGLIAAGGEPGDRLLVMAPNSPQVVFAWFGSACAGMAEVPINTAYRGSFLEHQVRTTAPRFAVIDAELAERFVESAEACATIERFYLVGDAERQATATQALAAKGWAVEPFAALESTTPAPLPEVRPHDLASVFFTSGTTGLSKGVMMPHAQMVFFADECVSLTRLTDADAYLSVGPLFHGNAQFLAALPALIAGARFVLRERFSASRWIDWVRDSGATVTNFVGVMMDFVWKQPARPDDGENELRCVFAAPTASSILDGFRERFGIDAFVEVFGLTETSMPIMTPYGVERPAGACGKVNADWFDVRLVDPETDEEVAVGQTGELVVRPRQPWTTCIGYYGMADKTAEAFRNLWFHTGDGLRRDADGWFYFVDRLKDAIRRRGENISSYEIEQAVLDHPGVIECAAIAVAADVDAGEDEVMLFTVCTDGASREDVHDWCVRRLPAFALPRYVRLVDDLPKTPSGKVRKAELRRLALERGLAGDELPVPAGGRA
ncbi:MAG TPA: AMP-binding protein [Thermoleophilaceae bacterium]|nr:AMP-binding protein [Thermoleophilaceae bacterium]